MRINALNKCQNWFIFFDFISRITMWIWWGNSVFRAMRRSKWHFVYYCLWRATLFSLSFHLFFLSFSLFSFRNQMGNLLKVLTCTEFDQGPNFFLDFESEQSFCLAWCLSHFPATNIFASTIDRIVLANLPVPTQQQNRASQRFCICKWFVQMSLMEICKLLSLFYYTCNL